MPGPLDGLLVVDATWGMPGGVAGMLLADYGATVVKLERPGGGADVDSLLRRVVDRSKWSITIDSATTDAMVVTDLLDRADVLLDSGRPGNGLLPSGDATGDHPHLVHCRITAYGLDGPMVDRPGYDALVAARLGLMAEQWGHRKGPVFLGHPTIDYVTAFLAVLGTLSALHARSKGAGGQLVDTSLMDGALAVSSMNWWWNEKDLSYLARSGDEEGFGRNRLITDLFQCGDGEYVMVHTGGEGGFKRTMDLLGLGEKIRSVPGLEMSTPLDDDEYHAARHLVPEVFLSRPRDEWIRLFHAADLAALPVLHPHQVLDDEQIAHARIVAEVPDDEHGVIRQVGPVVRFAASPPDPPKQAPRPGEHNGRLGELRARSKQTGSPGSDVVSAPLSGIRVLDFSAFFATAFGARLLSDLGADVIKIETPAGDQMRPLPDLFECAQRGKRNIVVDLRDPRGADVVARLIESADVVMHNLRPGKAERLGIGADRCRELNPDLIYCYLPGFGSNGPKADLKSFAPLVSGFTGMLYVGAGKGNPPNRRVMGNEDLYNGFLGAISVLMAVAHRDRTGEGQYVESPHLHSSLLVRTEQCADRDGEPLPALDLDEEQTGWGPLYRLYRTQDDWLALACVGDRAFSRLARALGADHLLDDERFSTEAGRSRHAELLAEILTATFATMSSADAYSTLDEASVACEIPAAAPLLPELLWDEWMLDTDRVFEHHHPEHGWIREVGHCVRLSATSLVKKGTSRRLGQDTRELLEEMGYAGDEIDELLSGPCAAP